MQRRAYYKLFAAFCFMLYAFRFMLYPEGSKDMYPSGALDRRAYMTNSSTATSALIGNIYNPGRMFVYVKAGEVIYVGASALNSNLDIINGFDASVGEVSYDPGTKILVWTVDSLPLTQTATLKYITHVTNTGMVVTRCISQRIIRMSGMKKT